jgi:predicted HNH restriction endonuclease
MRVAIDTNLPDADLHEFEATEGYAQLVIHLRRERSKDLVKRKKAAVKSFACEVCNFDFSKKYGAISSQYCEVHHLQPIGSMTQPKKTRLQDLAILCANCHRVIHLRNPPFTITELRISIANNTIISDPPVDFI